MQLRHLRHLRGLTLLELMVALALLAVLASLAVPSFGRSAERARLKAAAETLAGDLTAARFEAARRGVPLYVDMRGGADWCWAVADAPGCDCATQQRCQFKRVIAADHAGIALLQPQRTTLLAGGIVTTTGDTLLQSPHGEQLRVGVSPLGRAGICAATVAMAGYAGC